MFQNSSDVGSEASSTTGDKSCVVSQQIATRCNPVMFGASHTPANIWSSIALRELSHIVSLPKGQSWMN